MSIQIREPVFLSGRTDVVERATIISLILGGLGAVAGWATYFLWLANLQRGDETPRNLGLIWGCAALLVFGPINCWNRRSSGMTLLTIPINGISMYFFAKWLGPFTRPGHRGTWELVVGFLAVLIVTGTPLVRRSRPHLLAYALFVLGGLMPAALATSISGPELVLAPLFNPNVRAGLIYAAIFGCSYVALFVSWGIPFWWPPTVDAPPPELA